MPMSTKDPERSTLAALAAAPFPFASAGRLFCRMTPPMVAGAVASKR